MQLGSCFAISTGPASFLAFVLNINIYKLFEGLFVVHLYYLFVVLGVFINLNLGVFINLGEFIRRIHTDAQQLETYYEYYAQTQFIQMHSITHTHTHTHTHTTRL